MTKVLLKTGRDMIRCAARRGGPMNFATPFIPLDSSNRDEEKSQLCLGPVNNTNVLQLQGLIDQRLFVIQQSCQVDFRRNFCHANVQNRSLGRAARSGSLQGKT